jgi:uncharacterized membrane protein
MNKSGEKSFWTIVFTELTYAKPLIVGSYLLFGIPAMYYALTASLFQADASRMMSAAYRTSLVILMTCIAVCFVMLLLEIKESRLRQMVSLPMSISSVRISRILLPLVVWFIYLLLLVSCIALVSIGNEIKMSVLGMTGQDGLRGGALIQVFGVIVGWLLAGIYALRLLTEWQGRVLLGMVVLAWFCLVDSIPSQITAEIWGVFPWAFPVVSIFLLDASFRSRKAFLE